MEYNYITQVSRKYEYGLGKEFETKEEAKKALQLLRQKTMTDISLVRLYDKVDECKMIEKEGYLQLTLTIKIPKFL